MGRHSLLPPLLLSVSAAVSATAGDDWPQWRGPGANGVSRESGLPSRWGRSSGIEWKAPLAGLGTSTPILYGDRIFLTYQIGSGPIDGRGAEFDEAVDARRAAPVPSVTFVVEAFDKRNGSSLFRRDFPLKEKASELPPVHPKHNLATPSIVTDGDRIFAWSGAGQLVALDFEGETLWEHDLGREYAPFDVLWGHGSSPMLYGDRLFVLCDHPPGAYLLAFDKKTGEELLRIDRGEGIRSYTTPFLVMGGGDDQLIVNGSDHITAYDPVSGKELWRFGEPVTLAIPMPVADTEAGVLYASRGYSSGPYSAIRLGGHGDVTESHALWHVPTSAPYISSFVLYEGLLYMATERGIASAVDPGTGETVWRERLGGAYTASPVAGDGKIYFLNEAGETVVLAAGRQPKVLARNALEERTLASPAISERTLYIRTDHHLIAIGGE